MTEAEWLACADPGPMLEFLRGKASDRKLRPLMAAACRRLAHLLDEPEFPALIEAGERVAEGTLSAASLARYRTRCPPISASDYVEEERRWQEGSRAFNGPVRAKRAVWLSGSRDLSRVEECLDYAGRGLHARPSIRKELVKQCHLILDIMGDPFRPVTIDPAWLRWNGGTVAHLAQAAYDERHLPGGELDRGRLGILADALEDEGCTDPAILDHLRGPGVHVRGCWCLDLLLGKE